MHVTWCQRELGEKSSLWSQTVIFDLYGIPSSTLEIRHGCSGSMIAFGYVSICIDGVFKKLNVTVEDCKHNVTEHVRPIGHGLKCLLCSQT